MRDEPADLLRVRATARPLARLLRVAMDDGTPLATALALPHARFRGPALLVRTPYEAELGPSTFGLDVDRILDAGFALVVQDVRGRGASGGRFGFVEQERDDGRATLAWIARQPWSDGRVATAGASYLGRTQLVLGDAPQLVAMIPAMAALSSRETWWHDGALDVGTAGFWVHELATRALPRLPPSRRGVVEELLERNDRVALVRAAIAPDGALRDLAGPLRAQLDGGREAAASRAPAPRVPSLHIAGWFASDGTATIAAWHAARAASARHHLIVGPWTHSELGETSEGVRHPGGAAEELGLAERQLAFLAHYVHSEGAAPPVAEVYVTGAGGGWRTYDRWPPAGATHSLRLASAPPALTREGPEGGRLVLRSRARRPVPSLGGTSLSDAGSGLRPGPADVRELATRDDVLALASAPLEQPLELAGTASLTARVAADPGPCGIVARLADQAPDGELRVVADAVAVRQARAGAPVELELSFSPAHHRFGAHRRVVLLLAGSEHPRYLLGLDADRTLQIETGGPHPAVLRLPVA